VYNNTEYTTVSRTLAEWRLGTTDVIDLCAMQKTMPTSLQQQYATEQGSTVSIYPNPTQQQFYVRGNLPANSSITLTDITGTVVLKQNVVAGQPITIDTQAKGLFLYQIYNEQQQLLHYGKLVVH
jgi:hypothetical protein